MTGTAAALSRFFGGFGIPAYTEDHIPDDASMPYISYRLVASDWQTPVLVPARVWYYGDSFVDVCAKVDEISDAIGEGCTVETPNGGIFLHKGDPFVQFQPFDSPDIRVAYLNIGMLDMAF